MKKSVMLLLAVVFTVTLVFGGSHPVKAETDYLSMSWEQIVEAAKAVGAHDFISKLPEGYETDVGENGVNLSVGQRQLVSFARALLAQPHLLVMDEATSSVDTATEKQIQRGLDRLMEGRTTFVIAHRLSTIVSADKIVVLDQGQIVEMGTHEQLLARQERYYRLYTMQWSQAQAA